MTASTDPPESQRLKTAMRWLRLPFASSALALALIGAAAVPAFLLAAGDLWQTAAGDDLTRRVIADGDGEDLGVRISTDAFFEPDAVEAAVTSVANALAGIGRLAPPVLSLYTPQGWALVGPGLEPAPIQVRLLARPGAIDALDVVSAGQPVANGVWISDWLADSAGIALGDRLRYSSTLEPEEPGAESAPAGGPTTDFTVVGIYRALWNEAGDPPAAPWRDAPDGIIPVYIRPFGLPSFALLLLDQPTLANTGVSGFAEWRSELMATPETQADLSSLAGEYAALEAALTIDSELAATLDALSRDPERAQLRSSVAGVLGEVNALANRLSQPLGSVKAAGIAIGLAIMMASGVLAVERRRAEYRLLAGDGDRWGRFAARAAAQLALPSLVGATVGIGAAIVVALLTFPRVSVVGVVGVAPVLVVTAVGLVSAALTTGLLGQATLGSERIGPRRRFWPAAAALVGIAWYLWIQVGRTRTVGPASVDLAVAALPIAALMAAVALMLVVIEALARRSRLSRRSLPPIVLLAWRRITAESVGARLIVGALGVGIGLVVASMILVATLQRSVDVKSAVAVGAETSIELLSHPGPDVVLPERTTIIAVQATRTTPGNANVTMVAVDPATFAGAVTWPSEYGGTPQQLLDLLDQDVGYNLPVVGITGQVTPQVGGFGTYQSSPYQLVARFHSVPLAASVGPTLVVSALRLDRFELERTAPGLGLDPDDPRIDELVVSPVEHYRPFLVSQQTASELEPFLSANDLVVRKVATRDGISGAVDALGARYAFDYMRLLGIVGAAASGVALALYLAARRRQRALARIMTRRMGLGRRGAALVTTLEVAVLGAVAAVTAALVAPRVTQRLIPRFDPAPGLPPALGVRVPAAATIALVGGVCAILVIVWLFEWTTSRESAGKVLRELN